MHTVRRYPKDSLRGRTGTRSEINLRHDSLHGRTGVIREINSRRPFTTSPNLRKDTLRNRTGVIREINRSTNGGKRKTRKQKKR
jgi:hypothetical protein